uniref:Uncharacterized protein n=1 Tax=Arundo donax TaxID=35708 RepID=A0A0A9B8S8_ARUDO
MTWTIVLSKLVRMRKIDIQEISDMDGA